MASVGIDTEKNRIGGELMATSRNRKDDPASVPYDATARTNTVSIAALDAYLEANGYTAAQTQVMNKNDKLFAYRQKIAGVANPTLI